MARVYALRDDPTRVVKIALDSRFNETMLQEARLSADLAHSAILPVEDFGVGEDGLAWILLPRLSARRLSDNGLAIRDAVEVLSPVADALDKLHGCGWIHGDVKPENILEGREGSYYLSDLGLARKAGDPRAGGTPAYLSPSLIAGKPTRPSDDRHAFAVTVFEVLSGHLPYVEIEGDKLLRAITSGSTHSFQSLRQGHPLELDILFEEAFKGEGLRRGLVDWINDLREALGMQPCAASINYVSPAYPQYETVQRIRKWLSVPFEGESLLGRAVLLREGGRREAELLREILGEDRPPWIDLQTDAPRTWIAEQESTRSADQVAGVLLASSGEVDEEREAYLSHRPDTLLLDPEHWRIESQVEYLESGLFTMADRSIHLGHEERRFLVEASGGDLRMAEDALAFLCSREILKAEREQARFVEEFSSWESRWRNRYQFPNLSRGARRLIGLLSSIGAALSREECRESLGVGDASLGLILEELRGAEQLDLVEENDLLLLRQHHVSESVDFRLSESLFPKLWNRTADRKESRLRILLQALRQGAKDWILTLDSDEILQLGDEVSLSALTGFLRAWEDPELPGSLRVLACVEKLRKGELPGALASFWNCEVELSLATSAELNRRFFHSLQDEISVEEGFAFLERWREVRGNELEGSELEIRILAREVISHGQFGSFDTAMELIDEARIRFAGRDGLFLLDWAEAEVHGERGDRKAVVAALKRAYESVPGEAPVRDRFSLCVQLASHGLNSDDPEQGRPYLERSAALAAESGDPELDSYLTVRRAAYEKKMGNTQEEIRLRLLALRQIREAGLWRIPMLNLTNPLYALLRLADYPRLMPLHQEIERHVEVADQVLSAMLGRIALARVRLELGDFDACLGHINENLELADELGSRSILIRSLLTRGYLYRLFDMPTEAMADFQRVERDLLEDIISNDFVDLRLEILQLGDPDRAGDFEVEMELESILRATEAWKADVHHMEARIAQVVLRRLRGDFESAGSALADALDRIDPELYPTKRWPLYLEQCHLLVAQGDQSGARRAAGRALEILEGLSRRFSDPDLGSRYLARPDRAAALEMYRSLA